MRVLTFTNLPYENNLYRVIQGSIALHSMVITLNKEHKKHFRLNKEAIILFKAAESSRSVSRNILIQPAIYTITGNRNNFETKHPTYSIKYKK